MEHPKGMREREELERIRRSLRGYGTWLVRALSERCNRGGGSDECEIVLSVK